MLFHEKLRKLRREKNWSQAELSEHLGIHTSHIYRLETGKSAPSMELIQTIARVFDVTMLFSSLKRPAIMAKK